MIRDGEQSMSNNRPNNPHIVKGQDICLDPITNEARERNVFQGVADLIILTIHGYTNTHQSQFGDRQATVGAFFFLIQVPLPKIALRKRKSLASLFRSRFQAIKPHGPPVGLHSIADIFALIIPHVSSVFRVPIGERLFRTRLTVGASLPRWHQTKRFDRKGSFTSPAELEFLPVNNDGVPSRPRGAFKSAKLSRTLVRKHVEHRVAILARQCNLYVLGSLKTLWRAKSALTFYRPRGSRLERSCAGFAIAKNARPKSTVSTIVRTELDSGTFRSKRDSASLTRTIGQCPECLTLARTGTEPATSFLVEARRNLKVTAALFTDFRDAGLLGRVIALCRAKLILALVRSRNGNLKRLPAEFTDSCYLLAGHDSRVLNSVRGL